MGDLIREARQAQALVEQERTATLSALSARMKRSPSHFAKLVRLNYLAPDIITAILDGRQPPDLTRKKLANANLPMDWALQRKLLGFAEQMPLGGNDQRY